jgi:hypothetical protein
VIFVKFKGPLIRKLACKNAIRGRQPPLLWEAISRAFCSQATEHKRLPCPLENHV